MVVIRDGAYDEQRDCNVLFLTIQVKDISSITVNFLSELKKEEIMSKA